MLTEKQKSEYLEDVGNICPFCQSNDLQCSRIEVDSGGAGQDIECGGCGATWTDLYTLSDIVNINEGSKE